MGGMRLASSSLTLCETQCPLLRFVVDEQQIIDLPESAQRRLLPLGSSALP